MPATWKRPVSPSNTTSSGLASSSSAASARARADDRRAAAVSGRHAAELQRARPERADAGGDGVGVAQQHRDRVDRDAELARPRPAAHVVSWPWPCGDVPHQHGDGAIGGDLDRAELGHPAAAPPVIST